MVLNGPDNRGYKTPDLAARPGCLGAAARFLQRTYATDYVCLTVVTFGWFLIPHLITPFHRMFYMDNVSIQYPFAVKERVPVAWSVIYSGLLPLLVIAAWAASIRREVHFAHVSILGLLASLLITSFVTDIIKVTVGRPRPDLISRCSPKKGTPDHTLVGVSACAPSDHNVLEEGWRSFPSGHSSFAFAGLGYLFFFFAGQLHVFRPRAGLARFLFSVTPLLFALLIAISRLADYRHDVYDVTAGSSLGILMAYCIYRRYYPPLSAHDCGTPYPKRDQQPAGFFGVATDDEEQQLHPMSPQSPSRDSDSGNRAT